MFEGGVWCKIGTYTGVEGAMVTYNEVTQSIKISVDPVFLEEQSEPEDFHFVWAYRVTIENQGDETVQLMRRAASWSLVSQAAIRAQASPGTRHATARMPPAAPQARAG